MSTRQANSLTPKLLLGLFLCGMAIFVLNGGSVAAELPQHAESLAAERMGWPAKPEELDEAGWASLQEAVAKATPQNMLVAAGGGAGDLFGWSVAVSGDTALVGTPENDAGFNFSPGSAYVFVRSGNTWTQQQKLLASDGAAGDGFGYSIALSDDTALIGAPYVDSVFGSDQGSAYVFIREGTTWTQQTKFAASDGSSFHRFGHAVDLSGDTALVGAPGDDFLFTSVEQGSVYVFTRSGSTWNQQAKLAASDAAARDQFGFSVAVSGDTALVGAPFDDIGANSNQGSIHVFVRSGNTWAQQQKLVALDGAGGNWLGISVDLSGEIFLAGATSSAYVFVRSGNSWAQQQKLVATDGTAGDNFGEAVALSGNSALVASRRDQIGLNLDQGSAYLFLRNGNTWTQQQKLVAADGQQGDEFGQSVALFGDTALFGAPFDDIRAPGTGTGSREDQGSASPFLLPAQPASVALTLPGMSLPRCIGVFSRFDYSWVSTSTRTSASCQAECPDQACRDATTWAGTIATASLPAAGSRSDRYVKPTPSPTSGSVQLQIRCFTPTGGSVSGLATLSFRAGTGAECGVPPPPPASVAAAAQPDGSTQLTGSVSNPGGVFLFAAISQQGQYGDAEAEMNGNTLVVRYQPRPESLSLSKGPVTETIRVLVGDGATAQEREYSFQVVLPFIFENGFE